jgi:hypothetical protein
MEVLRSREEEKEKWKEKRRRGRRDIPTSIKNTPGITIRTRHPSSC